MHVVVKVAVVVFCAVMVPMAISAPFRIEGRGDMGGIRAEAPEHRLDDMILADEQPVGLDLHREMAITEMPGEADEMALVSRADLEERLVGGSDRDNSAVFEDKSVAIPDRHCLREVEEEVDAPLALHPESAPMTVV